MERIQVSWALNLSREKKNFYEFFSQLSLENQLGVFCITMAIISNGLY